jgi:GntR family transcriptional regulator
MSRQVTEIERITGLLRARILGGEFGADGQMPTEADLCAAERVSRPTIREAYRRLMVEGLVVSVERRGYFVHYICPITLHIDRYERGSGADGRDGFDQWAAAVAEQGRRPRTDVPVLLLDAGDPMHDEVRGLLGLPDPSVQVVVRRRTCFVDDTPFMTRDSYFPEPLARGTILMAPGDQVAPGGLLAAIGRPAAVWRDTWRARMPTPEETRRLALPQITPGIHWIRARYGPGGEALAVMSAYLPGDRVQLAAEIDASLWAAVAARLAGGRPATPPQPAP